VQDRYGGAYVVFDSCTRRLRTPPRYDGLPPG
jgi:hypothetical protein